MTNKSNKKRINSFHTQLYHKESWNILNQNVKECIYRLKKLLSKDNYTENNAYILFREIDGVFQSQIQNLQKHHGVQHLQIKSNSIGIWQNAMVGLQSKKEDPKKCQSILHILDCTVQKNIK